MWEGRGSGGGKRKGQGMLKKGQGMCEWEGVGKGTSGKEGESGGTKERPGDAEKRAGDV